MKRTSQSNDLIRLVDTQGKAYSSPQTRPVASLKTARGHRPRARGHIICTRKKVVTKSPSQPITARGLGERCKPESCSQKVGGWTVGENSVWSSTPRLGGGYQTCWWGELRVQPEPRTQCARESTAKPEIERGEGVWGGGSVSPSPAKL